MSLQLYTKLISFIFYRFLYYVESKRNFFLKEIFSFA